MTAPGCAETRLALGTYVLGALEPTDRREVESHLDQCAACRDELAELAGLPGLLAHVDLAEISAPEPSPPPELLDRLLAAASADRRTTRWRRVVAAAAAVAIGCAGGLAAATQFDGDNGASASSDSQVFQATDPASHVTAHLTATPRRWGTAVRIQLTGVEQGQTCSLVVVDKSGTRESIANWEVTYDGRVEVDGSTDLTMAEVVSYEIVTKDGQRLVTIRT